jgi:chromosome segregation ATPase
MKKLKDNENESSSKISDLTSQINSLQADISSLLAKKNELEEQIICKSNEARELGEHNLELRNQISELEMKSKEREDELSAIMKKLKDNENESSSKISDLTSQINSLQADISSLLAKKNELEEQIVLNGNEASTLVESLTNELKAEKIQLVDKSRENSECLIQIESLKEEVGRKTKEQERLIEDRENLTRQLRDLELEMSTLKSKNSKDEEQIRANSQEISHFQHKIYKAEEEASGKIIVFTAQVDNLQKELLSMQKTKEELDLCCEKLRQEHAQTHTIVDNNIMDLKRTLKEVEDAYQKLNVETWKRKGMRQGIMR